MKQSRCTVLGVVALVAVIGVVRAKQQHWRKKFRLLKPVW